ncbi:S-layer homology domain-containing protein [Saccharibacillus sp. O23]|uniref:S-layer homology domain-containing protein n=1 Tax=Saccharibacillus sp. O23 TaxID=2009338 RepID=UPI0015C60E40|nr:S-layer homology domain-containing protein [Saccharibacillus sp. O23]
MKNKKIGLRIASTGLAAALLASGALSGLGSANAQYASVSSGDVKGHWAESRIVQWTELGWIRGYADGKFHPDDAITRAEFVALANRAFGLKAGEPAAFKDVQASSWAAKEVSTAAAAGYAGGTSDGLFRPDQPITRQEAALMIVRLLKLAPDAQAANVFADAASMPEWSKGAIGAAADSGIIGGYSDRTYRPAKTATRAEAIAMLQNAIDKGRIAYDKAGTYGPATGLAAASGGAAINVPGVTLQNTIVSGSLKFGAGIGEGDATLKNVTVLGQTEVRGGGAHSIHLVDSSVPRLLVDKQGGTVRTVAEGDTDIGSATVNGAAVLEEAGDGENGFHDVELASRIPSGASVSMSGQFDELAVNSQGTNLGIGSGGVDSIVVSESATGLTLNLAEGVTVRSLELNAPVNVTGQGTIANVRMSESARAGSRFEKAPLSGGPAAPTTNTGGSGSISGPTNEERAAAVATRIVALPNLSVLKMSDEAAVQQALAAYDSLTAAQKALVSEADRRKLQEAIDRIAVLKTEHAADLAAAEALETEIAALPALEGLTLKDLAAVEAALAAFDALSPARKQLVDIDAVKALTAAKSKLDALAAQLTADTAAARAAAALIAALPEESVIALTDEAEVTAANAAYEQLNAAAKSFVAAEDLTKLRASIAKIAALQAQLAADIAAAKAITQQIAALPETALLALTDAAAVAEARTAYDGLGAAEKSHVSTDSLTKLGAAEARIAALQAQLAADIAAAEAVMKQIAQLPETALLALTDDAAVAAARAAYAGLTAAEKSHVSADSLTTLGAAETKIAALQAQLAADIAAAEAVMEQIADLPKTALLTLTDDPAVAAARAAYAGLTAAEKSHVSADSLATLGAAEAKTAELKAQLAADIAAAEAVMEQIGQLPKTAKLALTDDPAVAAARAAYAGLTAAEKSHVSAESLTTLNAAEAKIAELQAQLAADIAAAQAVMERIAALPATTQLALTDETVVQAAQAAYAGLNAAEKSHVSADSLTKLNAAAAKIQALKDELAADIAAAEAVTQQIAALPETALIRLADQTAVQNAQQAYEALTPARKTRVSASDVTRLNNAVSKIQELQADAAAAAAVESQIAALPATASLTLANEAAVTAAKQAYDALTSARKALVSSANLTKLGDATDKIAALKAQLAIDQQAADDAAALIAALPAAASLTFGDKAAVDQAQAEFAALTSAQQGLVSSANRTKLNDAVARIAAIAADVNAAASVTALIEALPATASLTLSDESAVQAAQNAYAALTSAQQAYVSAGNRTKLADSVAKITSLKGPYVLKSKDIMNFNYVDVQATAPLLRSKPILSKDFSSNPVDFTIYYENYVIPIQESRNLQSWEFEPEDIFGGVIIDTNIQMAYGSNLGSKSLESMQNIDNSDTVRLNSTKTGSSSYIRLTGNWQPWFEQSEARGTDAEVRQRSFVVSNGTASATITLSRNFVDPDGTGPKDSLDALITYINGRLSANGVAGAAAVRSGQGFELQLSKAYSGLTISGTNKDEFFTEFSGK